ncbi:rod shape-determining protein MreD [Planctomycetota bacterium]
MHWIRFYILLMFAMLVQASFIHIFALADDTVYPQLLLILMVFAACHFEGNDAIIACFSVGLATDIIGACLGPYMIAYGLIGTGLHELRRFFAVNTILPQALAIAVAGFLSAALTQSLIHHKGLPAFSPRIALLFWSPLYSSIVGPLVFLFLQPILGIQRRRSHRSLSVK